MTTDTTTNHKRAKGCFSLRNIFLGLLVFSCLFYVFFLRGCIEESKTNDAISKARDLGLSLFAYAQDHDGKYPEGKTSTEIFQKLLDGGYLANSDSGNGAPDLLYYPIPGKVKAAPGTKILKPENVCWDVTCCMDAQSPDELPMIVLTGYKVTYQAGASAIALPHPPRSWLDWWQGKDYPTKFLVANYKSNSTRHFKASPDGTIPNFIPTDFDPEGKTYRQLTPDGELPP